ncbi:GNAT family N-acetyltransferase [Marivirga sp.]|uniref:GNAT family N-acetyltransferase n=1 Tax=Marivirga sp. TaxID=2018662 RepID=UPI002D7F826E|nr:GNAT family N-acetyltransferase [Marivirga sp.]HET8858433.1 GNAT family N-acetyltransferase [Marivirga sp.]
MNIEITENAQIGKLYIGEEKNPKAAMEFTIESGNIRNVKHTEVSEELKGQSVGRKLLDNLAEKARKENFKIKADCSYVQHVFEKYDDYDDVKA